MLTIFEVWINKIYIKQVDSARRYWFDFADDKALVSHTHKQVNIITNRSESKQDKTNVLRNNTHQIEPITLAGESLEDVTSFTYRRSVVDQNGGTDLDVKARI